MEGAEAEDLQGVAAVAVEVRQALSRRPDWSDVVLRRWPIPSTLTRLHATHAAEGGAISATEGVRMAQAALQGLTLAGPKQVRA